MKEKYDQIITFLKNYFKETNGLGAVVGISGGKDSTVVAKLLVDAIGKDNVLGVLMPNGYQSDLNDSKAVCILLDIPHTIVNIETPYNILIKSIETVSLQQVTKKGERNVDVIDHFFKTNGLHQITEKAKTNIAPRLRMTTLYAIAQSLGYRVAGTGNKSEQFIGWFTKWGDGACDINPIAHLTCTEVIELGDFLELPKHLIHKTPADGLTGKSDEENFGFTYKELDKYIEDRPELISDGCSMENFIIEKLHNNSRHKFSLTTIDNYGNE